MIDLVFWSFVVALAPIFLSIGSKIVAIVLAPLGPPAPRPITLHGDLRHAPHGVSHWISRPGGLRHGR